MTAWMIAQNWMKRLKVEEDLDFKYMIHRMRMMEEVKDDIQFSHEIFNESLNILKKKAGWKYDFLTQCGQSLRSALYNMFKVIWDTERKPDMWRNTVLLQWYKGHGPRESLEYSRNIHTKLEIPKFFSHIVTTAAKPILFENMSPYQIGTKPGHRSTYLL